METVYYRMLLWGLILGLVALVTLSVFHAPAARERQEQEQKAYTQKLTSEEYKENFKFCMDSAANLAPKSVHYNDLDEAIWACREYAMQVTKGKG